MLRKGANAIGFSDFLRCMAELFARIIIFLCKCLNWRNSQVPINKGYMCANFMSSNAMNFFQY